MSATAPQGDPECRSRWEPWQFLVTSLMKLDQTLSDFQTSSPLLRVPNLSSKVWLVFVHPMSSSWQDIWFTEGKLEPSIRRTRGLMIAEPTCAATNGWEGETAYLSSNLSGKEWRKRDMWHAAARSSPLFSHHLVLTLLGVSLEWFLLYRLRLKGFS